MRVQCDVCEKAEAAMMCCADEAALCTDCDLKVHAANKLAIKHQRVSLFKDVEAPCCDICQEKTGYFFCVQERALLCRNCDVSIHTANALSSSHKRFLVTGVRVSLEAITSQETPGGLADGCFKCVTSTISPPPTNASKSSQLPSQTSAPNAKGLSGMFLMPAASNSISGVISESSSTPSSLPGMAPCPSPPSAASESVPPVIIQSCTTGLGLMSAVKPGIGSMPEILSNGSSVIQVPDELFSVSQQSIYGNSSKRNSITEFLTEAIPEWQVDELLNISDLAGGYALGDVTPAKEEALNPGDFDWTASLSLFEENMCGDSFHKVPEFFSLGAIGLSRPGRLMPNPVKGKAKQDFLSFPGFADSFVVPDLRLRSLPDSPPPLKRRRYDQFLGNGLGR